MSRAPANWPTSDLEQLVRVAAQVKASRMSVAEATSFLVNALAVDEEQARRLLGAAFRLYDERRGDDPGAAHAD